MKKIRAMSLIVLAMAAFAFMSCRQAAGGLVQDDAENYPTLNEAEEDIAGKIFRKGSYSYAFYEDKTGVATNDDGISGNTRLANVAGARAAGSGGEFEWSARQNGNNIDITITQNGENTNASFNPLDSTLSVAGQKFDDGTDRIVTEMNLVRKNPALYAQTYLQPRLANFRGNDYISGGVTERTQEGAAAVREAINEMQNMRALKMLSVEQGLRLAAKAHAVDRKQAGGTGHQGSDGSMPPARMARYGTGGSNPGENINYGRREAREIVIQLLIDDGTADRGHRKNILNNLYTQAGSYTLDHPTWTYISVINFNNGYKTTSVEKVGESLSDKVQKEAETEPTAGSTTPTSLSGTSWIEVKSNAPSTMYMAMYFADDSRVNIGACNSKVLSLTYAKSNPGGAGHHYETTYSYINAAGSITQPSGAAPHYYGNISVSGDILTLTNGSIKVVFRKFADVSSTSIVGTKWTTKHPTIQNQQGFGTGSSMSDFFNGSYAHIGIIFESNSVKISYWNAADSAEKYVLGESQYTGWDNGSDTDIIPTAVSTIASYTYNNSAGNIATSTWNDERNVKNRDLSQVKNFAARSAGNFTVDLSTNTITLANGAKLYKK